MNLKENLRLKVSKSKSMGLTRSLDRLSEESNLFLKEMMKFGSRLELSMKIFKDFTNKLGKLRIKFLNLKSQESMIDRELIQVLIEKHSNTFEIILKNSKKIHET